MPELMFEWFYIDPDPSLGGAIVLSIEVLSKTLKQACFQYKASELATQILCSLMAIMQCCLTSDLMFKWFKIDPDLSLGGAIALSKKVLSKT